MGKKSFHFSQNQPCLGLYAQWWISVYLHRPASLLCRKESSWVPDGFLESRNSFCFYLPTKCFLACPICFWRQLPCSPDRSPMACCLSSLLKQVSLHLIESFVFSMSRQFPRISLFTLIWRSLQTPGGSSRSHPGLRIPYFSFQILSDILLAAVTGHRAKYWWSRHPPTIVVPARDILATIRGARTRWQR